MTFHRTSRIALLFALASATTVLAMRLCGHEVPNVQRITACMHKLRAQVSPGCRAVMERENAARRRAAATDE